MAAAVDAYTSAPVIMEKLQENVANISYLLQKGTLTELPKHFVWDELMRSNQAQEGIDEGNDKLSLPVIDISALRASEKDPAAVQKVLNEMGDAAKKWGFFQVVNHGIPEELMKEVRTQGYKFFNMPVEVKEKAKFPIATGGKQSDLTGYNGRMKGSILESNTPWTETLTARGTDVESLTKLVWPQGNPSLSKPLHEYWTMVENVGWQLIEALAQHAGVDATTLKHYTKPDKLPAGFSQEPPFRAAWRLCHYPACPRADQTLGLGPHADPNILTLLQQDEVGGLQIRMDDKWIDVTPLPGALCINVGDSLEAWSNGRFKSIEHRVLVNEKSNRLSAAYFIVPGRDQTIVTPPQLIDDELPSLYSPYLYGDYLANIFKSRLIGKSALEFVRKPIPVAQLA